MNSKVITLIIICINIGHSFAQVGIGTTNPRGALEVSSSNTGFVPPQVALTASNTTTPILNPQGGTITSGTLVWNTATSGVVPNNVTPGLYFWNGLNWISCSGTSSGSNDWSLTGNTGTSTGTNFIGTTDAQNLQINTAGNPRMIISGTNGNIAMGTNTIPATTKLEVSSGATSDAISGHSDNVDGVLGREINISFGNPSQILLGAGLYANNPSSGYTSIYGQSTGLADVAASVNYSDVWIANYNYVQNASDTYNASASYNQLNITNSLLGGVKKGVFAVLNRLTIAGNPGSSVGVYGQVRSQNENSIGIQGNVFSDAPTVAGGYFQSASYSGTLQGYAYVGTPTRKIIGLNSVSEIIPTEKHGRIALTCSESPEYWYQDYGTVQLKDGKATIFLDEIFADIIVVDEENPIRVVCTPVKMTRFNGISIQEQTKKSVTLLELNNGKNNGTLQYQIVAKPKTGYGEGRFPQAPGPSYVNENNEPTFAKAKNKPNTNNIYKWPEDHIVYKYNPEDYIAIGDVIPVGKNAGKIKLGNGKYADYIPVKKSINP